MTLASLLGLKPAIETVRDLMDANPLENQMLPNSSLLLLARVVELVYEVR